MKRWIWPSCRKNVSWYCLLPSWWLQKHNMKPFYLKYGPWWCLQAVGWRKYVQGDYVVENCLYKLNVPLSLNIVVNMMNIQWYLNSVYVWLVCAFGILFSICCILLSSVVFFSFLDYLSEGINVNLVFIVYNVMVCINIEFNLFSVLLTRFFLCVLDSILLVYGAKVVFVVFTGYRD